MSVDYTPDKNNYKSLGSFRFWCQKVLPMVYDDSLSYYEVLGKLTNYLNDVIYNVNKIGDDVTNLHNAYVLLQDFVNHYFDNLDVQHEINTKLDNMAKDGSLGRLVEPFLSLYTTTLTESVVENQRDIGVLKGRVDALTKLGEGSTTGDAELVDARVGFRGRIYDNAGDNIRGSDEEVFRELDVCARLNYLSYATYLRGYYFDIGESVLHPYELYDCFDNIYLPAGTYKMSTRARFITNMTENTQIGSASADPTIDELTFTIAQPCYFRVSVYHSDGNWALYRADNSLLDVPKFGVKKLAETVVTDVYEYPNLLSRGTYLEGHFLDLRQSPSLVALPIYNVYLNILLDAGTYEFYPRARFVCNHTTNSTILDEPEDNTFTLESPASISITMFAGDNAKLVKQNTRLETVRKVSPVLKGVYNGNSLSGKKWVACGDSFTAAGYNPNDNIPETEYVFQSGPYAGKQITYPYIIGLNNDMIIENLAVGGMSMAKNSNNFYFADGRYKNIPLDADYITLWFGINDDNFNSIVGEITDTTTDTFYGAWNTVMEYLLVNHPFAKIGVVITNGSSPEYTEAERNICKRWGIPFLDLEKDLQVPLMLRVTEREGVQPMVLKARNKAFVVSDTNHHPNTKAQYYQSTFIENWLRSL